MKKPVLFFFLALIVSLLTFIIGPPLISARSYIGVCIGWSLVFATGWAWYTFISKLGDKIDEDGDLDATLDALDGDPENK